MSGFYEFSPLAGVALNIVLAFFVLRQNLHRQLNLIFSLFLISMGMWAFAIFGMRHIPTLAQALPWEKAFFAVMPLVSVFFLHFVILFIGKKKLTWQLPVAYASIPVSIAIAPTSLLVTGMREMWYGPWFCSRTLIVRFHGHLLRHRSAGSIDAAQRLSKSGFRN